MLPGSIEPSSFKTPEILNTSFPLPGSWHLLIKWSSSEDTGANESATQAAGDAYIYQCWPHQSEPQVSHKRVHKRVHEKHLGETLAQWCSKGLRPLALLRVHLIDQGCKSFGASFSCFWAVALKFVELCGDKR